MFDFLKTETVSSTPQQIARSMRWLGWAGFWLQALLGFIPLLVVVTSVLFNPRQGGFSFGIWLAIACLGILIFSIYWCFRYTQLANKLTIRELRPAKSEISRDLKFGLLANLSIMALAVLIALARVGELSFKMLTLPQGSTVITPNQSATMVTQGAMIPPSTIIAIQAMVNAIAAGLVGAIVAIMLLYQLGQNRND
ncbi:DUF3611 family protein [Chlorogloeopsis sp. ULAP02]|uniref:DUF3611 family protein n=1 Tax=Chlorogloeopsis sp. ULAP02 TaxID=3107926 RepID=UPI003135ABBC